MNIEQLTKNVTEWSVDRGIPEHSTYGDQIDKFTEELEEFKDAIGDMCVCLINARLLATTEGQHKSAEHQLKRMQEIAGFAGVDFGDCLEMAWEAIRYRVGLMIDGKFVKWENLSHEQRMEVAHSGQLEREGVNLNALADHCAEYQWDEIHEARNG